MPRMPESVRIEYNAWVDAFDVAVGAYYPEDDMDYGAHFCRSCDALKASADSPCAQCDGVGSWDLDMDLEIHDRLWPNGYGAEGDPGHSEVLSVSIVSSVRERYGVPLPF